MDSKLSVKQVVEAIERLGPQERLELVTVLPAILKLSADDYGWLKLAEPTFSFWNNDADAIYDGL